MIRVLFIGDIHIKYSNIHEVDILIQKIKEINPVPDFVVLAGDLLHTHEKLDTQLLNKAYELINELRKYSEKIFIIVGNHDYINNQQFLTENHWMNGMKEWEKVIIVDKLISYKNFIFVPYVFPGRFIEALETINDWKNTNCIFCHQEIKGCKLGPIISTSGDEWDKSLPLIISGHIHENHKLQTNVYYPGSVLNHSFSYDSQGLSIFIFENGNYIEEKINLGLKKKKIIYGNVSQNFEEEKMIPENKFSLSGNISEIIRFKQTEIYKQMIKNKCKVMFKIEKDDIKKSKTTIKPFFTILEELLEKENDKYLIEDYKLISSK